MSKRIFIRFIKILTIGLLMMMFAAGGYFVAKKSTPSEKKEGVQDISYNSPNDTGKIFPNLPVGINGTFLPEENTIEDTNDYLVISYGNLVNLYSIDKEGRQIFERVLDIDLASLKAEDRALLKEGIVLSNRAELLSLIEDYSS